MTTGSDYNDDGIRDDDEVVYVEDEETEAPPARRGSPLRIILLVLLLLVVLCCGGALLLRNFTGNLVASLPIPGLGAEPVEQGEVITDTPTAPEVATEELLPAEGEPEPGAEVLPETETEQAPPVVEATPEALEEETQVETPELLAQEPTAPAEEEMEEPSRAETAEAETTAELPVEETEEQAGDMETMDEMPAEATEEAPAEVTPVPGPTATATLVLQPLVSPEAGPTTPATPAPQPQASPEAGPTVVVTVDSCQNNDAPSADANGPYTAMLGKGQAFITLDAGGSTDPDGSITEYEWDFGDGSTPGTGKTVTHGYGSTGVYTATLTVTDNCGATGESTAIVTITAAAPPATATPQSSSSSTNRPASGATAEPASAPVPASATLGFCYLVQAGDTLSSIGTSYGVSVQDLTGVNALTADYLVAGQGLFIPSGEIYPGGANVYRVQPGDTLTSVASRCGLSSSSLAAANGMMAQGSLVPGQFIAIPTGR